MATSDDNSTGLTIAMVGGGALLLWLLWPGRDKHEADDGDRRNAPSEVLVWIRSGDRIDVDGASSDLATTVARARAAGAARVFAAGDARQGWVTSVLDALYAAGVAVAQPPSVLDAPRIDDPAGPLAPRNARTSRIVGRRVPVEAHTRRWPRHGA
jgi:hypothetical protein